MHWSVYLIVFVGLLLAFACTGQRASTKFTEVLPVGDYKALLSEKQGEVQLLDVRTAREYAAGHIEGAQNLDVLDKSSFAEGIQRLDPAKPVMLYCRSGRRSANASALLEKKGFTEIYDLKGGFVAWSAQN
jgi:rhodanese-related sulfurtransferase